MNHLAATVQSSFANKRIAIIGDLVADQFLHGTIARVSREAPVFILRHDETRTCPGGAANAAVNVASLGGEPLLIGLTGQDANGELLRGSLARSNVSCDHIITAESLKTTTKVRVLAGQHYAPRQQVIRIDYENSAQVRAELKEQLKQNLIAAAEYADAVIVSDYNYGVTDPELMNTARKIAGQRGIPLLIDSRFRLREYPNATTATPNQEEVEQILGKDFSDADCSALCENLGFASLLITCGNKGMLLIEPHRPPLRIDAIGSAEPIDVTGAGDTVIAVYALGLASGLNFADAAAVANHAGGIVVMKKGTASVSIGELLESINANPKLSISESAS